MEFIKKNFFLLLFLLTLLIGSIYIGYINKSFESKEDKWKKEMIDKDSIQKVRDGEYRKLVDTYAKQKDLNDGVKKLSPELSKDLKDKKEKPVLVGDTKISFEEQDDEVDYKPKNDTTFNFTSVYPKTDKPFITYEGEVNTKTQKVKGKWKFGEMKLGLVVTEKENGLWDSYVVGESFVKVTDISVKTLPRVAETPKKGKLINTYGGAGVIKIGKQTEATVNLNMTIGRSNNVMISTLVAPTTLFSNTPIVAGGVGIKF